MPSSQLEKGDGYDTTPPSQKAVAEPKKTRGTFGMGAVEWPPLLFQSQSLFGVSENPNGGYPPVHGMKSQSDAPEKSPDYARPLLGTSYRQYGPPLRKASPTPQPILIILVILCALILGFVYSFGYRALMRLVSGYPFAGTIAITLYKHVPLASFDLAAKSQSLPSSTEFGQLAMKAQLNPKLIYNLGGIRNPAPLVASLPMDEAVRLSAAALAPYCSSAVCPQTSIQTRTTKTTHREIGNTPQANLGETATSDRYGLVGLVPCCGSKTEGSDVYDIAQMTLDGTDFSLLHTLGSLLKHQDELVTSGVTDGLLNDRLRRDGTVDPPKETINVEKGTHVVPLQDYENVTYYGIVKLGPLGEEQEFSVVFDTGSANLWIPSSSCESYACLSHHRFKNTSMTSVTGTPINMTYGSGSASGVIVHDELEVGGIRIPSVYFGTMTNVDALGDSYRLGSFDGVFGLGWPSLAVDSVLPPFNVMLARGILSKPLFSFTMKPETKRSGPGGQLILGGWREESILAGETISWIPLEHESFWQAKVESIKLGEFVESLTGVDDEADELVSGTYSLIVDSGTSLITAPSSDVQKLAAKMGAFSMPTQPGVLLIHREFYDSHNLNLNFDLRNQEGELTAITIRKSDWIQCPLAPPAPCILSLQALDIPAPNGPLWILGDIFMARYTVIFDTGGRRIGLAKSMFWGDEIPSPLDDEGIFEGWSNISEVGP